MKKVRGGDDAFLLGKNVSGKNQSLLVCFETNGLMVLPNSSIESHGPSLDYELSGFQDLSGQKQMSKNKKQRRNAICSKFSKVRTSVEKMYRR